MKKLYVAMASGIIALFGIAMLKNNLSYSYKSLKWRLAKSAVDTTFVTLAAVYLPALLLGWIVMWLTRPIARRGVQVTLAILFGVLFGAIGGIALEALCVLAIFAVDLVTGENGVYGWWKQRPPDSFMPYLVPKKVAGG